MRLQAPSETAEGRLYTIHDDDDKYLRNLRLSPALFKNTQAKKIIDGIQAKFAPAYIQIVNANTPELNPRQEIPFHWYAEPVGPPLYGNRREWDNNRDLPLSTERFWTWLVAYGYQPEDDDLNRTNDPDGSEKGRLGATPQELSSNVRFGYSVVYVESIREDAIGNTLAPDFLQPPRLSSTIQHYQKRYWGVMCGVTAHEIGHGASLLVANAEHLEGGLMGEISQDTNGFSFKPVTVARFRRSPKW